VVTLADSTGYKNAIRDADPNRTVDVDAVYTAAVVFAVIVTLLIAALYVFLAINLRKGKNWARITTWVIVGIFTLLGLLGLGNDAPGFARVLGIIVLLANAATLVLLAMRPSNEFFTRMRQPQHPQY
jgi:quinol-cytochrome oxidoreductase complex cytochrome b subunit